MDNYIVGFCIFEKWSHDAGDADASDGLNWASHLNMLASVSWPRAFSAWVPKDQACHRWLLGCFSLRVKGGRWRFQPADLFFMSV